MPHLAVSAIGADRPGIVAAVTGVLVAQGANLEDTSMSVLRGQFAMMLVVSVPPGVLAPRLEAEIGAVAADLGLAVMVRPLPEGVAPSPAGAPWTVSLYGADHPGIVHRLTAALAAEGVNIVDLTTRVIGEAARPVYAMFLDVTVPPAVDATALVEHLRALAGELGVSCTAHPTEVDIL